MTELQDDAARLSIGLRLGIYTAGEVITWAEGEIRQMDQPSRELVDLALMPNRHVLDMATLLEIIAGSSDRWQALRCCLCDVAPLVHAHPDFAPVLARRLYELAVEHNYAMPDDLKDMPSFDDSFDLARQGIFAPDDVLADFIRWCAGFGQ